MAGPKFIKYIPPVVAALQELGGSGTPSEVRDIIIRNLEISEKALGEKLNDGTSRFENQVAWARFYLVHAGYIGSSKRGIWTLSEQGLDVENAKAIDAMHLFKKVRDKFEKEKKKNVADSEEISPEDASLGTGNSYRKKLLDKIKSMSPGGFERLCQRLLRESGFQKVVVTGKSGDGGIDGHGILQVNPFVSFNILFQCKRYKDSVAVSHVRDFRGAMMGRADKGIILTTGTFTHDSKMEASRDGVPPIELVDGEKLVEMFEELELGLIPRTVYEVDDDFFDEFE
nr:restriction endonuclease [uncultured Pseudodesulfovibrio sp.]